METNLIEAFVRELPPRKGLQILDLGSGSNVWSMWLANFGHHVTAVDRVPQSSFHANISYHQAEITAWLHALPETVQYDGIFLRYVLNFFSKEAVRNEIAPLIRRHLKPGGVLAIEDMTQPSEPPIDNVVTYWTMDDIWELFPDFKIRHEADEKTPMLDMRGESRMVYKMQYVGRCESKDDDLSVGISTAAGYTRLRLNA